MLSHVGYQDCNMHTYYAVPIANSPSKSPGWFTNHLPLHITYMRPSKNYHIGIASTPEQAVTPQYPSPISTSNHPNEHVNAVPSEKLFSISMGTCSYGSIPTKDTLPNIHRYPPKRAFLKYRNAVPPRFYFSSFYPIINPSTSKHFM
jgi:hypothetical protein